VTTFPAESQVFHDSVTGAQVRRLTSHPSIHHHPFFYVPAYSADGIRIVFVSHRSGSPQIYTVARDSGEIFQVTNCDDLGEWSLHPAWNENWVLFLAGGRGYRADLTTGKTEEIADFRPYCGTRGDGMIGAGMGVTALSWCDRYWAVRVTMPEGAALIITDFQTGKSEEILKRDEIGHLSFCPDDSNLLFVARSLKDRVWLVNRDGSGHRRLYARKSGEWITHEFWIPGTRELAFVDLPNGIRAISVDSGTERRIADFNAWHAVTDRRGGYLIADTNFPDNGLQLLDLKTGAHRTLCFPGASNAGAHWNGPFPYENGPIEVYAPQHTHPHPSFSPDGKHVVFTSDCSGYSQIYDLEVPS